MKNIFEKIIEYSFYIFVFVFIFQTKLILIPSETNYGEVSFYLNYLLLFLIIILFLVYRFKFRENIEMIPNINASKHWVILAGLEFFIFISLFFSSDLKVSLFKYFLFLLGIGLLFLMLNFKFNFKKIILVFLSALLIQAGIGIYQFFSQESFSNKYLGIAEHDASVLGVSVLENDWGRFVRAYGALDHPNIFGALMFFGIIFLILLIVKSDYRGYKKVLSHLFLFILMLALIVSFSRSALLALVISLSFLLIIFWWNKNKKILKNYLSILFFLLIFSGLFFFILKPLIINRFNPEARLEKISIQERGEQVSSARDIIKNNTWWGVGIGSYHQEILNINSNLKPYQAQPVHNTFLLIWSEIGLWGFICVLWLGFNIFKNNFTKIEYLPLFIGIFIFMMLDHWLWSLPFGLLFLFFFLGLTFSFKNDIV